MFCENCGAKIEDGQKFCTECGTKAVDLGVFENSTESKETSNPVTENNTGYVPQTTPIVNMENESEKVQDGTISGQYDSYPDTPERQTETNNNFKTSGSYNDMDSPDYTFGMGTQNKVPQKGVIGILKKLIAWFKGLSKIKKVLTILGIFIVLSLIFGGNDSNTEKAEDISKEITTKAITETTTVFESQSEAVSQIDKNFSGLNLSEAVKKIEDTGLSASYLNAVSKEDMSEKISKMSESEKSLWVISNFEEDSSIENFVKLYFKYTGEVKTPKVTGMKLSEALNTLKASEFSSIEYTSNNGKMIIVTENWEVISQSITAGKISKADTQIVLTCKSATESQIVKNTNVATKDSEKDTTKAVTIAGKTEKKRFTLGDTINFDGFEIKLSSSASYVTVNNQYSDLNGKKIIKIPGTLKNVSDETKSFNMFFITYFGPNGTELSDCSSYFDEDAIEWSGELRPGASKNVAFYILYDGKGVYGIDFDNWSSKITVEFNLK